MVKAVKVTAVLFAILYSLSLTAVFAHDTVYPTEDSRVVYYSHSQHRFYVDITLMWRRP